MKICRGKILRIIMIVILIILYIIGVKLQNRNYVSGLILCTIIMGLKKLVYNSFEIKVLIIFIIQYLIYFLEYFIFGNQLSIYLTYNNFEFIYFAGMLTFLFTSIFFLCLDNENKNPLKIIKNKSVILFYLNLLLLAYFLLTGVSGKIGDYTQLKLSSKIEYSTIFYLLLNYYSDEKKINIINILYIIFAGYLFLIGTRVPAIQIVFTILICTNFKLIYKKFSKKTFVNFFKENKSIILILLGIVFMKLIEKIRSTEGNILERVQNVLRYSSEKLIINNEADVIYSTAAILGMIKNQILTLDKTFQTWIGIFSNLLFLPFYENMVNIPKLVKSNTPIGGGGLISGYLYYLGREPLVIIMAILLGRLISNMYTTRNEYIKVYALLVVTTVFRWYPYGTSSLYKFSIYGVIWYLFNRIIYVLIDESKKMIILEKKNS